MAEASADRPGFVTFSRVTCLPRQRTRDADSLRTWGQGSGTWLPSFAGAMPRSGPGEDVARRRNPWSTSSNVSTRLTAPKSYKFRRCSTSVETTEFAAVARRLPSRAETPEPVGTPPSISPGRRRGKHARRAPVCRHVPVIPRINSVENALYRAWPDRSSTLARCGK